MSDILSLLEKTDMEEKVERKRQKDDEKKKEPKPDIVPKPRKRKSSPKPAISPQLYEEMIKIQKEQTELLKKIASSLTIKPVERAAIDVDAIQIAIMATRINVIAVNDRYASRAWKRNTPGSVVCRIPEFLAVGKVKTPKVITYLVIPVEQVHLAVFDNRSAVTSANSNGP